MPNYVEISLPVEYLIELASVLYPDTYDFKPYTQEIIKHVLADRIARSDLQRTEWTVEDEEKEYKFSYGDHEDPAQVTAENLQPILHSHKIDINLKQLKAAFAFIYSSKGEPSQFGLLGISLKILSIWQNQFGFSQAGVSPGGHHYKFHKCEIANEARISAENYLYHLYDFNTQKELVFINQLVSGRELKADTTKLISTSYLFTIKEKENAFHAIPHIEQSKILIEESFWKEYFLPRAFKMLEDKQHNQMIFLPFLQDKNFRQKFFAQLVMQPAEKMQVIFNAIKIYCHGNKNRLEEMLLALNEANDQHLQLNKLKRQIGKAAKPSFFSKNTFFSKMYNCIDFYESVNFAPNKIYESVKQNKELKLLGAKVEKAPKFFWQMQRAETLDEFVNETAKVNRPK